MVEPFRNNKMTDSGTSQRMKQNAEYIYSGFRGKKKSKSPLSSLLATTSVSADARNDAQ